MVTLNTLRNKGGVLLAIVIGVALLAFVLGDMLTSGSTLMNSSKMNVGTIDGEKITTQEYAQAIDELTEVQRITTGREGSSEEENEMIRVQAWDLMIRQKALKPNLNAIGLNVSEDEMVELLSGANPSPIIAQMFANYIVNPDSQIERMLDLNYLPTRYDGDVNEFLTDNEILETYKASYDLSKPMPTIEQMGYYWSPMINFCKAMWNAGTSLTLEQVKTGLQEVEDTIKGNN